MVDPLTVDENRARVRPQQSENELEHDGLSAPLAPSRIFMLPRGTVKLTSRRTTWSSKANDTWSNTTAGALHLRSPPLAVRLAMHLDRRALSLNVS